MEITFKTTLAKDVGSCRELKILLNRYWHNLLLKENKIASRWDRESVISWLLGEDFCLWEQLESRQRAIASAAIKYRYAILQQRYLQVYPARAYRNLIERLGSILIVRHKLQTWIDLSREKQRLVSEVIEEVIQEMLFGDRYLQQQIDAIARQTKNSYLANSLMLATIEEYCLRPIRGRPLLLYRAINLMRTEKRGGITQVPKNLHLCLINPLIEANNSDRCTNLLDNRATLDYTYKKNLKEQQRLRIEISEKFEQYLAVKVSIIAAKWLKLYLQGYEQKAIAKALNLPIKKVYRLREKITYHAIEIFAVKENPELVAQWLEIFPESNFGLSSQQWHNYWHALSPRQKQIVKYLKCGSTLQAIWQKSDCKINKIPKEWSKIYLSAHQLRNS